MLTGPEMRSLFRGPVIAPASRESVEKRVVYAPGAAPPLPLFCHAAIDPSTGFIFCSGSMGCNDRYQLVPGGAGPQTHVALENLAKVLAAAGSSLEQIVKVNVYLTNIRDDFGAMNDAYGRFFRVAPARTCIGVASLPLGACVQIECVALPRGG